MTSTKVLVYCATEEDRRLYPDYLPEDVEVSFTNADLTAVTAQDADGYDAVVVLTRCHVDPEVADRLSDAGVKYVLTRSAGYDHLDLEALAKHRMRAANVPRYSPEAIAEYAVMTTMMLLRKMKRQIRMIAGGDYTLNGIRGKELKDLTVGVIGSGRIGAETIRILHGFGGKVVTFDVYEREDISRIADYVSLEELYEVSDVIIYHCPLTLKNSKMLNAHSLKRMKDGVILINPARGGLWDYQTVLDGLATEKISGAAFDVYEQEERFLRKKLPTALDQQTDVQMLLYRRLAEDERVIVTAHSAFYTDTAIANMIAVTAENLGQYAAGEVCTNELIS